jgi:hypothetical protein
VEISLKLEVFRTKPNQSEVQMPNLLIRAKVITSVLLMSSMALAWGDLGHQTVGEIAERNLSPAGKKFVSELLGNGALAEAATFPDLARSDRDYSDFSAYHFIEIDPRFNGDLNMVPFYLRASRDADTIISNVPGKILASLPGGEMFNNRQRMDLVRYLVHVVGDVHQPLHVGNGYDHGANFCDVRYPSFFDGVATMKKTNLHSLWDSVLVSSLFANQKEKDPNYKTPGWKGYRELADLIMGDEDIQRLIGQKEAIEQTPVLKWYKESQSLHTRVYPDPKPTSDPTKRAYCKLLQKNEMGQDQVDERGVAKVTMATETATVDSAYMRIASELIKQQIFKAGIRLSYIINKIADQATADKENIDPNQKAKDLQMILEQFKNTLAPNP